jgi:carnitine-CoA ligase
MNDPAILPFEGATRYRQAAVVGELLRFQVATRPDAPALQHAEGEGWTWSRLGAEVADVQAGLARSGIRPGDHVLVFCDNSLRMAAALCAIMGCGAVVVPLNTALVGPGLRKLLIHSDARLLIVDPLYVDRCLECGVLAAGQCVSTGPSGGTVPGWEEVFHGGSELVVRGESLDLAQVMYTSGTTGDSKGAMLSHRSCLLAAWACAAVMMEAEPEDTIYTCLPFFHCAAQQLGLWTALLSGARLVFAQRFSASSFWRHIRQYGVKAFHFVGPMTSVLWKAPPSPDDASSPAVLAVGGGPRIAWREFEQRFGVEFIECYGMTETFGGCVSHRPGHGRSGKAGKALSYVDVKVVDEQGVPVPPGTEGHILLRERVPGAFFSGYYKRPDLTAAALVDGWYHTQDLGVLDEEGYLTWHSRARDILRHKGENVSAILVESTIGEHPGVAECGVAGVPSELGEDDLLAVVVPKGAPPSFEDLIAFASGRLPPFAVPRYFAIADALPKTATSRIQRHLLAPFLPAAFDRSRRK